MANMIIFVNKSKILKWTFIYIMIFSSTLGYDFFFLHYGI